MAVIDEKRAAPRDPVHLAADIEVEGRRLGCGVSRDASGVGFLLLTDTEAAVDSRLVLRLHTPGVEQPRLLHASVVRCEKIPVTDRSVWTYRVGVKLDQPSEDLARILASLTLK